MDSENAYYMGLYFLNKAYSDDELEYADADIVKWNPDFARKDFIDPLEI